MNRLPAIALWMAILTAMAPSGKSDDDDDSGGAAASRPEKSGREGHAGDALPTPFPGARYTVRLYLNEPDSVDRGQRVFDVLLQGRPVLTDFDIVQAAGAPNTGLTREFKGVLIEDALDVTLRKSPASGLDTLISGVELILEP